MLDVVTADPHRLLTQIRAAIDSRHVVTWIYDVDGDFTHTPEDWRNKAWMRPVITAGRLQFGIIRPSNAVLTKEVYGVYHGRFAEMLYVHFDHLFSSIAGTAKLQAPDSGA